MNQIPDLENKKADIQKLAQIALTDKDFFSRLLEGILSKKDVVRANSFHTLLLVYEKNPEKLYPKWDFFGDLLDSDNTYHKYIGIYLLANLLPRDKEHRFDAIFDKFYSLLNDSVVVAGHVTTLSAKIVKSRPDMEPKVTSRLLDIDKTFQKHKDLIKAGAIDSFDSYFESAKNKKGILSFVRKSLNGESPKTRKKAKDFLKKREQQDA